MSTQVYVVRHQGILVGVYDSEAKAERVVSYRGGMFGEPKATVRKSTLDALNLKAADRELRKRQWQARQREMAPAQAA
jgi:hypothetical protein